LNGTFFTPATALRKPATGTWPPKQVAPSTQERTAHGLETVASTSLMQVVNIFWHVASWLIVGMVVVAGGAEVVAEGVALAETVIVVTAVEVGGERDEVVPEQPGLLTEELNWK
jgi:hypothetical protein